MAMNESENLKGLRVILSPFACLRQAKADIVSQAQDTVTDLGNFFDEITKDDPSREIAQREQAAAQKKAPDVPRPGFARSFLVGYTTSLRYAKSQQDGRQLPLMPHFDMGYGLQHMPHM